MAGTGRGRHTSLVLLLAVAVALGMLVAPTSAWAAAGRDMYRLYNPNSGEHFYTANASERDNLKSVGWRYEGVGWTAPTSSKTPVYRLYSGTDHHYTTSASERDNLVRVGWRLEGIGWYSDDAKGVPLYRQYNPNVNPRAKRNNSGSHNYTASKEENDRLVSLGWRAEGIGWYGVKPGSSGSATKRDDDKPSAVNPSSPDDLTPNGKRIGEISYSKPEADHVKTVEGSADGVMYLDNEILVTAMDGVGKDTIASIVKPYGSIVGAIELTGYYQVRLDKTRTYDEIEQLCTELRTNPQVLQAIPSWLFEVEDCATKTSDGGLVPNDSLWESEEWSASNPGGTNWGVEAIDAMGAWAHLDEMDWTQVGIIDSSFNASHEDLDNFIYTNNNSPRNPGDGHGTAVSGIIGATFDNGIGIAGVFPKAELCGFADNTSESPDTISKYGRTVTGQMFWNYAIAQLLTSGCRVINLSKGKAYENTADAYTDDNVAYLDLEAETNGIFLRRMLTAGYDFLIVQAAGNYGNEIDARLSGLFTRIEDDTIKDRVIVVGAMQMDEGGYSYADFSHSGDRIDVDAPGTDIWTTVPTTVRDTGYDHFDGTSVAAPFVTGTAAMCLSVNPDLDCATVKKIIVETADREVSYGEKAATAGTTAKGLNAKAAVERALSTTATGKFEYPKSGIVMGRLVNEDGSGISMAFVNALKKDANGKPARYPVGITMTGSDGDYTLVLSPGTYVLSFQKSDYQTTSIEVEVNTGDAVTNPKDVVMQRREVETKQSVEDYTWAELTTISNMIAAAPSDETGLEIAESYNLTTSDGKLDGTQTKSFKLTDGTECSAQIIGFRHDDLSDGSGRAGITWMFSQVYRQHNWNPTDNNTTGWKNSALRTYMNGELLNMLPSEGDDDLKNRIQSVNKLTNIRDVSGNVSLDETSDKLWALSMHEVIGDYAWDSAPGIDYSPEALNGEGIQYQLFSDLGINHDSIGYNQGGTSTNIIDAIETEIIDGNKNSSPWWLRTPMRQSGQYANSDTQFAYHIWRGMGRGTDASCSNEWGVVPGFCLAGPTGSSDQPSQSDTPTTKDLSNAGVSSLPDQTWTGSPITPDITVTYGSYTLTEGTDYTVSYTNNVNVGTATVTITGIGEYAGSVTRNFNIVAPTTITDIAKAIIASVGSQVWTSDEIKPSVTVTSGGKTLTEGTDYTLSYANNVEVGTGTITITGKGSYTGSHTVAFQITQNPVDAYSWSQLAEISKEIAAAGSDSAAIAVAKQYGLTTSDGKLDGTQVKAFTLSDGTQCVAQIAGFRHDDLADGSGKAGITWVTKGVVGKSGFSSDGTNAGGWEKSTLRSYMNGDVLGELPADLKSIVKPVTKATNNVGSTTDVASVTTTTDTLWAFSLRELCGNIGWWASSDADACCAVLNAEGEQYQLFSDGGATYDGSRHKILARAGYQYGWSLRSSMPNNSDSICSVTANGTPSWNKCNYYGDVVLGFCV